MTIKSISFNTYLDPGRPPNGRSFQLSIEEAALLSSPITPGKGLSLAETHESPTKVDKLVQV